MSLEHRSSPEFHYFAQNVRKTVAEKILPVTFALAVTTGAAANTETEIPLQQAQGIQRSLEPFHFGESHDVVDAGKHKKDKKDKKNKKKHHRKQHNAKHKNHNQRNEDPHEVKVLYVLTSDVADEGLDVNGEIAEVVQSANSLMAEQTGQSFKFDMNPDGSLDIDKISINVSTADLRAEDMDDDGVYAYNIIDREVRQSPQLGKTNRNDVFLIFSGSDYTYHCGESMYGNQSAIINITNTQNCDIPSSNPDLSLIRKKVTVVHELFHKLGAVEDCAPNSDGEGHTQGNPRDLMFNGIQQRHEIEHVQIDPNRNNYFGEDVCGVNIQQSTFLTGNGKNGELPQGWKRK